MTEETWGQRVRRLRLAARMTQKDFAEAIGRTSDTIANWENGRSRMPKSVSAVAAKALGVSVDDLEVNRAA